MTIILYNFFLICNY